MARHAFPITPVLAACVAAGSLLAVAKPAAASTYTVTNTANSGAGSLRQAILDANGHSGADDIVFNISGPSPQTISPGTSGNALPSITDHVHINGSVGGVPGIELNGASAGNVSGLVLSNTADGSTIRGLIINGFNRSAIELTGTPQNAITGITIAGNYLGTNSAGTAASANARYGIQADHTQSSTFGGVVAADRNVISGNGRSGITLTGDSLDILVQGNYIGTDAAGAGSVPNGQDGIEFGGNPADGSNLIGGITPGTGNVIANNLRRGISIGNGGGTAILGNSMYGNVQGEIDLGNDGITLNDALDVDTGANNLQNYPVVTSAISRTSTFLHGSLNSTPFGLFRIEFFNSDSGNASGNGPAQTYLGSIDVTTDSSGNALFAATLPPTTVGSYFTATATDVNGNTSELSAWTVSVGNSLPSVTNDSYSVDEDATLQVSAPGVLANDTDPESDPLTAILFSAPAHGQLTGNSDGSFTYVPDPNYFGPDSFTYCASDGVLISAPVLVTLTVAPVNDPPVAQNDSYGTDENTQLVVTGAGVLGNDSDVENDPLTATVVATPSHGTLGLNADGSFTYTPATNYHGTDTFTYRVSDGKDDGNLATVTIAIAPNVVAFPDTYNAAHGTPLVVAPAGLLANDTSKTGAALTAAVVTGPSHGTLTLNSNGSFEYRPKLSFAGTDTFTYRAVAGGMQSEPVTVTIQVGSVLPATTEGRVEGAGQMTLGRDRFTFGLSVSATRGGVPRGAFIFQGPKIQVSSTKFTAMQVQENRVRVFGRAQVQGGGIQEFVLDVENVPNGRRNNLSFRLELADGSVFGPVVCNSGNCVIR